jgi:hypothetical protein
MNDKILYRIYADGSIVDEEDFEEYDNSVPYYDDYETIEIPEALYLYLIESSSS